MKTRLLFFIFYFIYLSSGQSQKIFLKSLLLHMRYKNYEIGMSFSDFSKIGWVMRCGQTSQNEDLYKVDTDYAKKFLSYNCYNEYAFNRNNSLVSINWEINVKVNEHGIKNGKIVVDLDSLLGKPSSEIEYNQEGEDIKKVTWLQDSLSLECYYHKNQNEAFIYLTKPSIHRNRSFLDIDKENDKLVKFDRQGKGNSSLTLNLSFLEANVNHVTLKKFELQLGKWSSFGVDNQVEYEWNDKTKDHDLPLYNMHYETEIKGMFYTFHAWVPIKLGNYIKELEIIAIIKWLSTWPI